MDAEPHLLLVRKTEGSTPMRANLLVALVDY